MMHRFPAAESHILPSLPERVSERSSSRGAQMGHALLLVCFLSFPIPSSSEILSWLRLCRVYCEPAYKYRRRAQVSKAQKKKKKKFPFAPFKNSQDDPSECHHRLSASPPLVGPVNSDHSSRSEAGPFDWAANSCPQSC